MKSTTRARFAKLMAAVVMVNTVSPVGLAVAAPSTNDLSGHWAEKTVSEWQDKGLIGGYEDGSFKPDKAITRAEFVRLMNQSMGLTEKGTVDFKDVKSTDWFYDDVSIAMGKGYVNGFEDGTFHPSDEVTRAQAAVMISNANDLKSDSSAEKSNFTDGNKIPSWANEAIEAIVSEGYMKGYPDGTFKANQVLTRAEAVSTLDRSKQEVSPEAESNDMVISKADTTVKDTNVEGNIVIEESVGDGSVNLENVKVAGNLIVKGGGANSVHLKDTVVKGNIQIEKENVRVVFEGKSEAGTVEISSSATIDSNNYDGVLGNVEIKSGISSGTVVIKAPVSLMSVNSDITVKIQSAVDKLTVAENGAKINIASNVSVKTFVANGKTSITGSGKIENLEVNVAGITSDIKPNSIVTADGVDKPAIGGGSTGGGSGSGSSGSGNSGNNDSEDTTSKVKVKSAYITGKAIVGMTLTASANSNATDPLTYQWITGNQNGQYSNIDGAVSKTYTLTDAEVGKTVAVVIKGVKSSSATSNTTAVVENVKMTGIKIKDGLVAGSDYKILYTTGEALSVEGLKVTPIMNDGSVQNDIDVTEDMVSGFVKEKSGNQTLTITYNNLTATYVVSLVNSVDDVPESIVADTSNVKKEYYIGEDLNVDNLSILVTLKDGSTETIEVSKDMISGFNSMEASESQTLTITYLGKTAVYDISIKELTTEPPVEEIEREYGNILNVFANPGTEIYGDYSTNKFNNFADLGAWHGYYLHNLSATNLYGGFAGPVIIMEEYPVNLSDAISKIVISSKDGREYDLASAQADAVYYPGRLVQTYDLTDFKLTLELVYATNRTALIRTTIDSKINSPLELNIKWQGKIYQETTTPKSKSDLGTSLEATTNGVAVNFKEIRVMSQIISIERGHNNYQMERW